MMPDVLDEIIEGLPPTTLVKIVDIKNNSQKNEGSVSNSLNEAQRIKIKCFKEELRRSANEINSLTLENRKYLTKLKTDIESVKTLREPVDGNQQVMRAYNQKLDELEDQIKILKKEFSGLQLSELFNNIEKMNKEKKEYEKRITEAKNKYQCYEGFPPNIEQAKKIIERLKSQIKHSELNVESLYLS